MKKEYREVKTATLYKIIETVENRNKVGVTCDCDTYELCRSTSAATKK
jgi:hypothetical protein